MRWERSQSNILFGHLPGQTVDAERGVWRVVEWRSPGRERCDDPMLRRELMRLASPWTAQAKDGGYVENLRRGQAIEILSMGSGGVRVEPFPRLWSCKQCGRIGSEPWETCRCGARSRAQLHFVAYHECGRLEEPYLPRCPEHGAVRLVNPGTSSARELRLECPECSRLIQTGLGFRKCSCGAGLLQHNVHRAAVVHSARTVVVVNAVEGKVLDELRDAGGPRRAVEWVMAGMASRDFTEMPATRGSMVQTLVRQGVAQAVAERMADQLVSSGEIRPDPQVGGRSWSPLDPETTEREAVTVATALYCGRIRIEDVRSGWNDGGAREASYRSAQERAGLEAVDLVDRLPVLTGVYGFTRGGGDASLPTLVPFRVPKSNSYAVYGDRSETEALFFRLDPVRVVGWLRDRGCPLPETDDPVEARRLVVAAARWPEPGEDPSPQPGLGELVLRLVHSYSHRVMRRASVLAGIDREGLSELLVPAHLGFFLYAVPRGAFVLGGLQAMFENDLDRLLRETVFAEYRCAMDPGCQTSGAACACCLHVGEPSCRWFNTFLDRLTLHGQGGFFDHVGRALG